MTFWWRAVTVWFLILLCAIVNGALRQGVLIPRLGEAAGHTVSTLALSVIVFVVTWIAWPWLGVTGRSSTWSIGGLWVTLTLAFEFLAGHYLFGSPWEKLLADYNLLQGRIWILVLLTTLLSPVLVGRARGD